MKFTYLVGWGGWGLIDKQKWNRKSGGDGEYSDGKAGKGENWVGMRRITLHKMVKENLSE